MSALGESLEAKTVTDMDKEKWYHRRLLGLRGLGKVMESKAESPKKRQGKKKKQLEVGLKVVRKFARVR